MQIWKMEVQKGKMCNGGKSAEKSKVYDCARAENASTEKQVRVNRPFSIIVL